MTVASEMQKFDSGADFFRRLARVGLAACVSAVRARLAPREHQHPDAIPFACLLDQHMRAAELDVIGMRAHGEDVHSYQPSASFANVRTHTPVGPLAMEGFASSSHAVPAMSRCTHGVSSVNSFKETTPAASPPPPPPPPRLPLPRPRRCWPRRRTRS